MCDIMRHYEDIARNEGMQEGMQRGMQKGIRIALIDLVRDGLLSASDAAVRLHISESEVKALAFAAN